MCWQQFWEGTSSSVTPFLKEGGIAFTVVEDSEQGLGFEGSSPSLGFLLLPNYLWSRPDISKSFVPEGPHFFLKKCLFAFSTEGTSMAKKGFHSTPTW